MTQCLSAHYLKRILMRKRYLYQKLTVILLIWIYTDLA